MQDVDDLITWRGRWRSDVLRRGCGCDHRRAREGPYDAGTKSRVSHCLHQPSFAELAISLIGNVTPRQGAGPGKCMIWPDGTIPARRPGIASTRPSLNSAGLRRVRDSGGFSREIELMDRATPSPPRNETVREYRPDSGERASLKAELSRMSAECPELPLIIGGEDVLTGRREAAIEPHSHRRMLAHAHVGGAAEANAAIAAAGRAWIEWSRASPSDRAAVFLKAAELLSGPWRDRLNAATMLGQSKTVYQAEIDPRRRAERLLAVQRRAHVQDP